MPEKSTTDIMRKDTININRKNTIIRTNIINIKVQDMEDMIEENAINIVQYLNERYTINTKITENIK